jgi:caa(3)-type oxidase subunit IV
MSDASNATAHAPAGHHTNYVRIWAILLGLLVVSVVGPMLGHPILTLFTAFGIAFIKAYLVIKHFMHLTIEKRYIGFLMLTMLAFMLIFIAGVSPDVMKHEGQRWTNTSAIEAVEKGLKEGGGHHESAHGAPAPEHH